MCLTDAPPMLVSSESKQQSLSPKNQLKNALEDDTFLGLEGGYFVPTSEPDESLTDYSRFRWGYNADSGHYKGSPLPGNPQAQPVQGFPRISDVREDYVGESGSASAPPQQRVSPGDGSSASSNQKSNGHSLDNSPLENSNSSTL